MIIAFAWVINQIIIAFRNRIHLRAQTEFHNKMMEKFSSAEEFTAYLQSEAGHSFFENLASEPVTPLTKILSSIQKGTILTLLGFGLIFLGKSFTAQEGGNIMYVIGVISFMTGAGFLVSSGISYRLAKNWDLIPANGNRASANAKANAT